MLIAITWEKIALRLLQLNPAELCRIDTSFTKLFVWLRFYFYTKVTKIKFWTLCYNYYLLKNLKNFSFLFYFFTLGQEEARVITITGFAEMTTSWSWHEFHDRKSIINFKSRTSNFKNWISNTWFLTEMKRKDIVCLTKYRTRKNVQSMIGSLSRIVRVDRWFVLEKSPVTWDGNILHLYGSNLPLTKIGFEKIKFIF